jgi:hypothetical protein
MSTSMIENPKIVSRDEWLAARKKLLAKEKRLTRERDALAVERRQLPWVKVEKNYVFDSPGGKRTLADLFDGRSQVCALDRGGKSIGIHGGLTQIPTAGQGRLGQRKSPTARLG